MCNSKVKMMPRHGLGLTTRSVSQIDGRPVLQPACNRVASLESFQPTKKSLLKSLASPPIAPTPYITNSDDGDNVVVDVTHTTEEPSKVASLPTSPKTRHYTKAVHKKRSNDPNGLNTSTDKPLLSPKSFTTTAAAQKLPPVVRKKSKKSSHVVLFLETSLNFKSDASSSAIIFTTSNAVTNTPSSPGDGKVPGSIAAAQRQQAVLQQAQRKMRIAHYGRTPEAAKLHYSMVVPADDNSSTPNTQEDIKRCSFITPNSDPLYVQYHDEEWGVPVHDDKMLFELLVLTGAQVGSDWTTILKKRSDFRSAFAGFDAEEVAKFSERQISSISTEYGIDLGRVRGFVDNSKHILEVRKAFGSLDRYLWGFVNHKSISTQYKSCRKIPVKTSKSETISKDMVCRGFRLVGPTVIHSFMQAAGLTNDHLLTCPRHLHCSSSTTH